MKNIFIFSLFLSLFVSCRNKSADEKPLVDNQDHLLLSVLWFQSSAEMKALFYQGYNIAEKSLNEKLKKTKSKRKKAVILDIDETVLDNSPVEALQVINNTPFSDSLWLAWVKKVSADALPGSLEFIKFADSVGVEAFYVSNRSMKDEFEPTLQNLKAKGFPFADSLHLILKTDISSKEKRRVNISEHYDILMLIGDNMADFDQVFDDRNSDLGIGATDLNRQRFGTDFIILPNPMYGPWINAALNKQEGTMREKLLKALRID